MDLELRPITADNFAEYVTALGLVFQFDPDQAEIENFRQVDELDRSFALVDDGAMVGTFGAFTFELATPGGSVAAGGLTAVSVLPTHRRRGVLTRMIHRHYDDVRERGEPVSILWASEWPIYSRFGYGQATQGVSIELDKRHGALLPGEAPGGCRMIDREEAETLFPEVYEGVRSLPGMLSRSAAHWKHRHFFDPESWRDGATAYRFAVYPASGPPAGYVKWRGKENWEGGVPGGTATVNELIASTPEAERGLWEFVLGLDLVTTIKAGRRPIDDPLLMMLADKRRLKRTIHDALWLAILDVPAALGSRRYRAAGELVIEVVDSFADGVDGRYRLVGGPHGAECAPTADEPDVTLSASELAALYLGDSRLGPMVTWGSARGERDAIRLAEAMFSWDSLPWCPEVF